MLKIAISIILPGVCLFSRVNAQQQTALTHALFNEVQLNPAFAGNKAQYQLAAFHHRQWLGLRDYTGILQTQDHQPADAAFPANVAPVATGFSFSAPVARCNGGNKKELGGFGISLLQDLVGYEMNTWARFAFAVALPVSSSSTLRWGIDLSYLNKRINGAMLRAHQNPDPRIPAPNQPGDSKFIPGVGLLYQNNNRHQFSAGLSVSGLNNAQFGYLSSTGSQVQITQSPHVYLTASARFSNTGTSWVFYPSVLLKSVNAGSGWVKPQLQSQFMAEYRQKIAGGLACRAQIYGVDAVSVLVGFYPGVKRLATGAQGRLRIGYSYDITMQSLRYSSHNTHELQVNYTFGRNCSQRVIRNPRDLDFNKRQWE